MQRHLRLSVLGITLGAALILTGCSAPADTDGLKQTNGGELIIGVSADLIDTIPADISQLNSNSILSHIYDTLVAEPADGTEPDPSVATDWTISPDGLEYVLTLRDDVVFHDGTPLTARDVAWTLEYARESAVTMGDLSNVVDIAAPDDTTVKITLSEPRPDLLMLLSGPRYGLLPADFGGASEDDFRADPVGSGPFKWANHTPGTDIVYDKFEDHWAGAPLIDSVHFKVFNDVNAEAVALQAGDIHMAENVPLDSVELMPGEPLSQAAPNITEIVQLNANSDPLKSYDLRRAMSLSIDRESLAESLLSGFGEPAKSVLVPSSFPDGVPEIPNSPYVFDLDRAKQLVDESGYAGERMSLIYSTGIPTDIAVAQALQAMWEKAGIRVELRPLDSAAWFKAITTPRPHHEFDLSVSRAEGFTPSPQLSFLVSREWYAGGWSVDDAEEALKSFGTAPDAAGQQRALTDFETSAAGSLKGIPVFNARVVNVVSDKVIGLKALRTQFYSLANVSLAE